MNDVTLYDGENDNDFYDDFEDPTMTNEAIIDLSQKEKDKENIIKEAAFDQENDWMGVDVVGVVGKELPEIKYLTDEISRTKNEMTHTAAKNAVKAFHMAKDDGPEL